MIDHHWFWFGRLHVGCPAHCQLRQQLWHKPGGVTWIHWEMNSYEKVHWEINTQLVDGLEHLDIFPFIANNHPKWLIFFRGLKPPTSQSLVCIQWKNAMYPSHWYVFQSLDSWYVRIQKKNKNPCSARDVHSEPGIWDFRYGMAIPNGGAMTLAYLGSNGGDITKNYGDRTDTCHCFRRVAILLSFGGGTIYHQPSSESDGIWPTMRHDLFCKNGLYPRDVACFFLWIFSVFRQTQLWFHRYLWQWDYHWVYFGHTA